MEGTSVALEVKLSRDPMASQESALDFLRRMHRIRALEERLILMQRMGEGHFWTGGPGEEAFAVALGLQIRKGQGCAYDFLHLHYRSMGVVLTMGAAMEDITRQMRSVSTDPYSGGRNFVAHFAIPEWNVAPVTSPIASQFVTGIGSALAQRRYHLEHGKAGVTVVVAGEAGTAMGDFSSALLWSSRPGNELPLLLIITNNGYGISTPAITQLGDRPLFERTLPLGIPGALVNGLSVSETWLGVSKALEYVRRTRRPYLLEVKVPRLYGHSSSSGANRVAGLACPIETFERTLIHRKWLSLEEASEICALAEQEALEAAESTRHDKPPHPSSVHVHTFANGELGGLPGRDR